MTRPLRRLAAFLALALAGVIAALPASAQSIIRDAEIETILREWTDPVLEQAGLVPEDVQLFIINDPSLNAFVANGKRIHLHTGLLIEAETPEQILGVIGHETCHIACGHSVSRSRAAEVAMRPALVSIGLGVLAMAAGEGEAGAALIGSSQQFAALNFFTHTRAEEAEADQAAVHYLSELGLSPRGLVEFMENFRYQEVLSEANRYPYFRAHPLAADRIRTTRSLAEETGLWNAPTDPRMQHQYDMMRAKLIGFLEPIAFVYREYPQSDQSEAGRYARAIASMLEADATTALREVDSLLEEFPDNPYYHELKGQILFETHRAAESVAPHARSVELLPGQPLLLVNLARSLTARGEPGDLERAEEALRDALIADPDYAFAWRQLAETLGRQDRKAEALVASAEAAFNVGDFPTANSFAGRAVRDLEPGTPIFRRASDILAITDPRLPENRAIYDRARRRP